MHLSDLRVGDRARIVRVGGVGAFRKRILEMGFVRGQVVEKLGRAPMGDPSRYRVMGYEVSLRCQEARLIDIEPLSGGEEPLRRCVGRREGCDSCAEEVMLAESLREPCATRRCGERDGETPVIRVALVGNPNSGKTSLFNFASGAREHTGNYSGVTVDSRTACMERDGYTYEITDLPGTYSLSAYTPEELYVRQFILRERPDVIINVVDSTNLERNLYLTLQLLEMGANVVVALNMWDELECCGDRINRPMLADLLGAPCLPTVGRTGRGIGRLFEAAAVLYEGGWGRIAEPIKRYGEELWGAVERVRHLLERLELDEPGQVGSLSYVALKLIERDSQQESAIRSVKGGDEVLSSVKEISRDLSGRVGQDVETYCTDVRYDFLGRLLDRVFVKAPPASSRSRKERIDAFLTHRYFGLPIFFALMWLMFWTTFTAGEYPMLLIEMGVEALGDLVRGALPSGPLNDLLSGGIIGGVGSVIVFLPQILILFFFIALLEDTGYMARAVFLMDRFMRGIGLHGRSFIPLVMGFGCNVPAIMATRTIEDRKVRIATMLINPFMSCSARLQVYILLASTIMPKYSATVLFGIYVLGIVMAVLMSFIFRKTFLRGNDSPFVMELPPYRLPTLRSALRHMWDKGSQYLRKMGGVILVASILIWFLGYFPRHTSQDDHFAEQVAKTELHYAELSSAEGADVEMMLQAGDSAMAALEYEWSALQQRESYLGRIGVFVEPAIAPLGFDWRIGVGLLSGLAAKEVVVSTLGVLLQAGPDTDEESLLLKERIVTARYDSGPRKGELLFTPIVSISLLVFVLLYMPCVAVVAAIRREAGSWKWAIFAVLYTTTLAYLVSLLVYQVGSLLM